MAPTCLGSIRTGLGEEWLRVGTPLLGQLEHISPPKPTERNPNIDSLVPMCSNLRATFQNNNPLCAPLSLFLFYLAPSNSSFWEHGTS